MEQMGAVRNDAAVTNASGHLRAGFSPGASKVVSYVGNMALNIHCSTCKLRASDVAISSKEI